MSDDKIMIELLKTEIKQLKEHLRVSEEETSEYKAKLEKIEVFFENTFDTKSNKLKKENREYKLKESYSNNVETITDDWGNSRTIVHEMGQ